MMGDYFGSVVEKFARCFESFIQDELKANGRRSDYLTGGKKTELLYVTGSQLPNGKEAQPYPHGEERVAINKALKNLLNVLKETGDIKKAFSDLFVLPLAKAEIPFAL